MKQFAGLILLLTVMPAMAGGGSWSSQSYGGILTRGQYLLKSRQISPDLPSPKKAVAMRLSWKILLDNPPPPGFSMRVCGGRHCLPLPSLTGELTAPALFPASGPVTFEYYSTVRGALTPAVTVLSNQVTVSYDIPF